MHILTKVRYEPTTENEVRFVRNLELVLPDIQQKSTLEIDGITIVLH